MTEPVPPGTSAGSTGRSKLSIAKLVLAAAVTAAAVTFAVQNITSVEVNFLTWEFDLPLVLIVALSAIAGTIGWQLLTLIRSRRS